MPFGDLRDELQVSDSVLSKQIAELEKAGFVKAAKSFVGKRPRTTLSLTSDGLGPMARAPRCPPTDRRTADS